VWTYRLSSTIVDSTPIYALLRPRELDMQIPSSVKGAAVVFASTAVGVLIVASSAHRRVELWPEWAALAVALCATAGAVFVYGWHHWSDVSSLDASDRARAAWCALGIAGGGLVATAVGGAVMSPHPGSGWRGDALVGISLAGGSIAAATMFGIRSMALSQTKLPTDQRGIADVWSDMIALINMRRQLRRLATALGTLVALSTLALGAATLLSADIPRLAVLLFGAGGSLIVGLCYVPGLTALRLAGEHLVDTVNQTSATSVSDLIGRLEERSKLEHFIGSDRSTMDDLQAAIPILGPLVAAAALLITG
jgi:hypothetical protein